MLKCCLFGVLATVVVYVLIQTTGLGAGYTHHIIAYASPCLIVGSLVGVAVPVVMLLTDGRCCGYPQGTDLQGEQPSRLLSTFERLKIEQSLNQTFKGSNRRHSRDSSDSTDSSDSDSTSSSDSEINENLDDLDEKRAVDEGSGSNKED